MIMEQRYIGIIELKKQIFCTGEVLGKRFEAQIGGISVDLIFPTVDESEESNNTLVLPFWNEYFSVEWGEVYTRPNNTSGVKRILCTFFSSETDAQKVSSAFPTWISTLATSFSALTHVLTEESPRITVKKLQTGGTFYYNGLELYAVEKDRFRVVPYPDPAPPINLQVINDKVGLTCTEVETAIECASKRGVLSETYILMEEASLAYFRKDYRSTISLCSSALESSIVYRVKQYCDENNIVFSPMGELGRKFERLKEYGIAIPIKDYKNTILNVRNGVIHRGEKAEMGTAYKFWMDCRTIIFEYEPNIIKEIEIVDG